MIFPTHNFAPRTCFMRGAFAVLTSLAPAACNGAAAQTCEAIGLCDPPPKPTEHIHVVCDRSIGSTCSRTTLDETLQIALGRLAERPGSRVRLWMLGADVATTTVVGEQTITAPKRTGDRARSAHQTRTAQGAREFLLAASAQAFDTPPARRSPLAEALTKVATSDAGGLPRRIILVTDAREVTSWLDFECGRLPTNKQFSVTLEHMHALRSGQLAGIAVELAHVDGRPVPGRKCPVSVGREARMVELWAAAFRAAGARHIRIAPGPARLLDLDDSPTDPGKE